MTINDRMKQIRKEEKLTQTDFAKRVGISMSSISQMERGVINPTNQTIEFTCREFNINREWLETGNGEMKRPPLDEVASVLSNVLDEGKNNPLYNFILTWIKAYQDLGPIEQRAVDNWMDATLKSLNDSRSKEIKR